MRSLWNAAKLLRSNDGRISDGPVFVLPLWQRENARNVLWCAQSFESLQIVTRQCAAKRLCEHDATTLRVTLYFSSRA